MLNLISSLKNFTMLGMVLGGLLVLQGESSAPQNAALTVPDMIFYGTARVDGEVLESGTVQAILPRGGNITADIAPVTLTDYNYSLSVPLDVFDDLDTAVRPVNAAVPTDLLEFAINGTQAHYRVDGQVTWDFSVPAYAMGQTYIMDLTVLNPAGHLMGDVNGNGYRDVSDALLIMRYTAGYATGDANFPPTKGNPYLPLCDIIPEGYCTDDDALLILKCEAGQPCTPVTVPGDPLNLTMGAALEYRVEVLPVEGEETTRTVQVIADDVDQHLGAASLKLKYDPADLTVTKCVTDPLAVLAAGKCYTTPATGTVRLNGVDLEGAGPGTVLAELTIEPVGDHSMDELEKQIYLDVYGSYDIEGVPLEWIKPFHFKVFIPLVIGGGE